MFHRPKSAALALAIAILAVAAALLSGRLGARAGAPAQWENPPAHSHWLASWAAAPEAASAKDPDAQRGFLNQTLREITFISSDGAAVRVHLSNTYGTRPLVIGPASVAVAGPQGAVASIPTPLTFNGAGHVTIPTGASIVSDPVELRVHALERLAVSLYLPAATGPITYHGASAQSAFVGNGDHVLSANAAWVNRTATSWYVLSGIDTLSPARYGGAVAAFGDSITAGFDSAVNTFGAWPDDLARRLSLRAGAQLSVIDAGINGNRVLNRSLCCGASGVSRFRADVIDQAGVREVILLEGINDIGFSQGTSPLTAPHTDVSAAQIIAGDKRIISAAHAAGLRIFGATLLPFRGAFYWTPAGEMKRQAINDWIRRSGAFDGVVDFAAAMAEPGHRQVLTPAFDSGDHLHPNNAGYARMADTIRLAMLTGAARIAPSARPHR